MTNVLCSVDSIKLNMFIIIQIQIFWLKKDSNKYFNFFVAAVYIVLLVIGLAFNVTFLLIYFIFVIF